MRLLILGTGGMAAQHAKAFAAIPGVSLAACSDVDPDRAREFAKIHGVARVYQTLSDALNGGGIDAVANVTPDAAHHSTTMEALSAGLHVFCEKPLATNFADADEMDRTARAKAVVNGVNLTYRNVAALQQAAAIVRQGRLGALRHFEASYLQSWLTQPAWGDWRTDPKWLWRLSEAHGSKGVLGDVGIHILDFLTFAAGSPVASLSAELAVFDKAPGGQIGDYVLDANDSATMTAALANGARGVVHATRFASGHLNDLRLRLYGSKGGLEVTNTGALGTLRICEGSDLDAANWRDVTLSPVPTTYRRFAAAVSGSGPMTPDFSDAARLQRVLDAAYGSAAGEGRQIVPQD